MDVRSAGISEVVEQERIVELPLQGREVTDLIVLAGAAFDTGRPNTKNFQGGVSISVAGGMIAGVAYILDGAMHNDPQNDGGLPLPFPDALQEFRVATSGLSAQNGMHAGAVGQRRDQVGHQRVPRQRLRVPARPPVQRDESVCDSRRRTANASDDGLRRNQYGGTIGGPIVRDRLFFFGGYQGTTTRVAPTDEHRLRADGGDAGRRLHGVRVAGVQQRPRRSRCVRRSSTTGSIRRCSAPRR